jgi:hypothetical protein
MAVILHWADGISEEHLALSHWVCERESPVAQTICLVLMGAGTEDVPYTLVEIEDDVPAAAGPSHLGVRREVVDIPANVITDEDPVPAYEA